MLTKWTNSDVCKFAESNKIQSLLKRKGCLSCCNYHALCRKHSTHARCEGIAGMTAYYTPEMVKLVVKGMSQELKPETLQKELRVVLNVGVQHQKNSQLYARRTTFFQGQLLTCCRWRRFRWWTTQVQSDKTQRGQCLSLEFIVTFESPSFWIFNFFGEATSPGAAGFPGGQIDPRQSTELTNEESEMLKSRNREKTEH